MAVGRKDLPALLSPACLAGHAGARSVLSDLLHQSAHQIRVAGGIVQRQSRDQQRLIVQQLGVDLGLFRVGGHGVLQSGEGRVLRVQLQNPLATSAR